MLGSNNRVSNMRFFFIILVFFCILGCSDSKEEQNKGVQIYYVEESSSYEPSKHSAKDWSETLKHKYNYDSIVKCWDLNKTRVCVLRKANQLDTYFLEQDSTLAPLSVVNIERILL